MYKGKAYKLSSIEDAIKSRQQEAKRLQQDINSHSANARDVLAAIARAESAYEKSKAAFKSFQELEKEYQKELDRADDSYRFLDQDKAFGKVNRLYDINEELKRYGAKTFEPSKARIKEMRDAVNAWKMQQFPKLK